MRRRPLPPRAEERFALARRPPTLLSRRAWLALIALCAIGIGVPLAALVAPESSAFHLSAYAMTLTGKLMCYAIAALALDLVWGYCGILSLGHGLFFALGGYAIGMYLMREIGRDGKYGSDLPDFMVFLDWHQLPWYWSGTQHLAWALALVVLVPAVLAWVFGFFTFRSRVKGVYDHHAGHDVRRDAAVLSQRDRLRRQQQLHRLQAHRGLRDHVARHAHGAVAADVRDARARVHRRACDRHQQARACRHRGARRRDAADVPRLQPARVQAVRVDGVGRAVRIAGALYAAGRHHQPGEMSPGNSIEMAIWVAVGGRGDGSRSSAHSR